MNDAHLHLLVNHVPAIGAVIGFIILLAALIMKNASVLRAGLLVLVGAALLSIPAFLTGEGAEEAVEEIGRASHDMIHDHEEHGETFFWSMIIMGVLALVTLILDLMKKPGVIVMSWIVLLVTGYCIFRGVQTNNSGGLISHPEISDGPVAPSVESHSADEHENHDH